MNGLDLANRPDSFALAQAARRHSSECLGRMFDVAVDRVDSMIGEIVHRFTEPMQPLALRRHSIR